MKQKSPVLKGKYRLIKVNSDLSVYAIEITDKIRGSFYIFDITKKLPERIVLDLDNEKSKGN